MISIISDDLHSIDKKIEDKNFLIYYIHFTLTFSNKSNDVPNISIICSR